MGAHTVSFPWDCPSSNWGDPGSRERDSDEKEVSRIKKKYVLLWDTKEMFPDNLIFYGRIF